jgi:hypothetical protein
MECFGVVHRAVTFTFDHGEGEAAFVARVRDRISAQPLKLPGPDPRSF